MTGAGAALGEPMRFAFMSLSQPHEHMCGHPCTGISMWWGKLGAPLDQQPMSEPSLSAAAQAAIAKEAKDPAIADGVTQSYM